MKKLKSLPPWKLKALTSVNMKRNLMKSEYEPKYIVIFLIKWSNLFSVFFFHDSLFASVYAKLDFKYVINLLKRYRKNIPQLSQNIIHNFWILFKRILQYDCLTAFPAITPEKKLFPDMDLLQEDTYQYLFKSILSKK